MDENLPILKKKQPYLKGGLLLLACVFVVGGGFLSWKAPTLVKSMAKSSLEKGLAPLGIQDVEIEGVSFGWGRIYLRDIHSKKSPTKPHLSIQEMDLALSIFFNVKAVDVIGGTLELEQGESIAVSKDHWQNKAAQVWKTVSHLKNLKLPTIAMQECLVVIPSSQGQVKLPIHATTQTTVTGNKVFTIDWGETGSNQISGQFVLDTSRKGTTIDIHATNIDFQSPDFQIKAPEISLWGTTGCKGDEGYKLDGFAKLDRLKFAQYGSLKLPLEVNLQGEGSAENFDLDELTIATSGGEKNFLELEGTFKPLQPYGKVSLTTQIAQLSNVWDFTPLLATSGQGKVSLGGKINLTSEIVWEGDTLKTSVLALELKGGTLTREGFSIEGVNTQFLFNKLHPLTTKGNQLLTAKKLSIAGIEARDLDFQCLFDTNGLFQIKQISADVLGGNMKAHRFQREIKATHPTFQFETDFKDVELGELLKLTDLDSLKGQAKLAGNAALSYSLGEGLDVLQAELHSISDSGVIQYKPAAKTTRGQSEHEHVNMANQVLDNFNFTVFNVRLEHAPDKPTELQGIIKMLGSNPNFLNGYPFEFNIVTTGPLKDLAMSFLNLMKPPSIENASKLVNKGTKQVKRSEKELKVKKEKTAQEVKAPEPLTATDGAVATEEAAQQQPTALEVPIVPETVRKVAKLKKVKKTRMIKARKGLNPKKKAKSIKATRTVNHENRKLSDG